MKPSTKRKAGDYVAIASKYIEDVLAGTISACSFVKQACMRQRTDLVSLQGYRFDVTAAEKVCKFLELLPHIKGPMAGKLIRLEPWQVFVLTTTFGWLRVDTGTRRFRRVYIEVPRGNGKTTIGVGPALYMLGADKEGGAEVYAAARTRDQAKIGFGMAQMMCRKQPDLKKYLGIDVYAHRIVQESSGSYFEAVSADADSLDGKNVHFALIDELHAHRQRDVYDAIETGAGKRNQSLIWAITTAGSDRTGICYEQRGYTLNILKGTVKDETHFGVVYTTDPEDAWDDPAAWAKANPNWGVSVEIEHIRSMASKAASSPASRAAFLTKHLNTWVSSDHALYDILAWDRCADKTLQIEDFTGEPCILGLDLASKTDVAALVAVFEREGVLYAFPRFYLPEDAITEGRNASYRGWQMTGQLIATDGDVTDFDRIKDDILEISSRHQVVEIAFDPWQATKLSQELQAEGAVTVEYRHTVATMSEPTKELDALMRTGKIRHDGNQVFAWMIGNVVGHYDAKDNVYPRREGTQKIDGAIALIMALGVHLRRSLAVEASPWDDPDFKLAVV